MADLVAIIDRRAVDDPGPTREMLEFMRGRGCVKDVGAGEVKSLIVCSPRRRRRRGPTPDRIVLSPISVGTLHRRVGALDEI